MTDPVRKRLLVVGCPRSGTRYMHACLHHAGVGVQHERMGPEGSVSSMFAVFGWQRHALLTDGPREHFRFDHIWHLVRHPLKAVASMNYGLSTGFWEGQAEMTGVDVPLKNSPERIEAVARFWVAWNLKAESQLCDQLVRVEDLEREWPRLMYWLGQKEEQPFDPRREHIRNPNDKDPKPLTWSDLGEALYPVKDLAMRYGYGDR